MGNTLRRAAGAIDSNLVVTVAIALVSGVGGATVGVVRGAWTITDRVTKLEAVLEQEVTQRREERDATRQWRARVEDKLDRLIERVR